MAAPVTHTTEYIIEHGSRLPLNMVLGGGLDHGLPYIIVCADGFMAGVLAGFDCLSVPRMPPADPGYPGPYTKLEVTFPTMRPEPWLGVWERFALDESDPTGTVYANVPAGLVLRLVRDHGGEDEVAIHALLRTQQRYNTGSDYGIGADAPQ